MVARWDQSEVAWVVRPEDEVGEKSEGMDVGNDDQHSGSKIKLCAKSRINFKK